MLWRRSGPFIVQNQSLRIIQNSSLHAPSNPQRYTIVSVRRLFKTAAEVAYKSLGLGHGLRFWQRHTLRILTYHRFGDPGLGISDDESSQRLQKQCSHLQKHYQPVTLTEGLAALNSGMPIPKAVAVTVDDGYRDYSQVAAPIFRDHGIRPTIFLVSDFMDRRCWLWWDYVNYAFHHTSLTSVAIQSPAGHSFRFDLNSFQERQRAAVRLTVGAVPLDNEIRLNYIRSLADQLGVQLPAVPPSEYESLQWEEARSLSRAGVEFGSHTKSHPILSTIPDAQRPAEILGSKQRIEEELSIPVHHFCFPNGGPKDYCAADLRLIREAGYEDAVTTSIGLNKPGADPYSLVRINCGLDLPPLFFERKVAAYWRLIRL